VSGRKRKQFVNSTEKFSCDAAVYTVAAAARRGGGGEVRPKDSVNW